MTADQNVKKKLIKLLEGHFSTLEIEKYFAKYTQHLTIKRKIEKMDYIKMKETISKETIKRVERDSTTQGMIFK